jgi:hypothetical protein
MTVLQVREYQVRIGVKARFWGVEYKSAAR